MKNYINKFLSVLLIGGSASIASATAPYAYLREAIGRQYGIMPHNQLDNTIVEQLIELATQNREPVERDVIPHPDVLDDLGFNTKKRTIFPNGNESNRLISSSLVETWLAFQFAIMHSRGRDWIINEYIDNLQIALSRLQKIKNIAETGNIRWENLKRLQETNLVMPAEQAFFEQLAKSSRPKLNRLKPFRPKSREQFDGIKNQPHPILIRVMLNAQENDQDIK